jgi:hypothetical protein
MRLSLFHNKGEPYCFYRSKRKLIIKSTGKSDGTRDDIRHGVADIDRRVVY